MDVYLQELAKAGISTATKFLLEKVLGHLSEKKYAAGKELIEELLIDDNYTNFLTKHVSRTIKIRTIHSSDKDIYLNDIYHALSIINVGSKESIKIKDGYYLENDSLNNIIGFAGQGKSTILRKLFIEQLKNGEKIPFFIELSKAEKSGILKQLESILIDCGIKTTEDKLDNLLSSGRIMLLLDGFDEVSPSNRKQIINEIISIHRRHGSQIITTTRPDTEICHEANIINYNVLKLKKTDILAILKRLNSSSSHIDEELIPQINKILSENQRLAEVMNLPILVTLFYICYPLLDKMPRNSVDFYENLFATLYLRHDKVKNFERHKSSSVSYTKAYEVFCALSFMSLYNEQGSFNELSFYNFVEKAMQVSGLDTEKNKPEELASDFVNVTCLIQKDGYDRFVYLHKSVQEYHASEFIKNMNTEKKEKLYEKISGELIKNNKFSNVVSFLSSTDEDDVISNIIIPLCETVGIDKWDSLTDVEVENLILEIMSESSIEFIKIEKRNSTSITRVTAERDRYSWLSIFNKGNNSPLDDGIVDDIIDLILKKGNGFNTDDLDSSSIPYRINEEERDDKSIQTNKFIKATGIMPDLIIEVKKSTSYIFNSIYKKNKEQLAIKNKSLEKYFDFL